MSESGLHTHAPHEEAVEHGAAHGPGLSQWVAIFTALLAALGAIVSYQGSQLMDEVLLAKNDAVLKKAHATDQWNYYQAISTKLHLMELARDIAPPARQADISAKIDKYVQQKDQVKAQAEALEAASTKADVEAAHLNRPHKGMARSMIALQIAISLASITALTRKRWLFGLAILSALAGVGLWATALGWVAG